MNILTKWKLAIRPKTLTASAGPVILGVSLAYHLNGTIHWQLAFATLLCALCLQISTNLVNDYYDGLRGTDTNNRIGPTRVTQTGLIPPAHVKRGFIITFGLSFLIGIYLMYQGGLPIILIGVFSFIFAYLYTGGPFPLSHYALGELLAFIFFGPVAVWGSYFLQTQSHHILALLIGAGPGFISAALMAINNLRDQGQDKLANKTTMAVLVGETHSRIIPLFFIMLSIVIPVLFYGLMKSPLSVNLVCFVPFLFISSWQRVYKAPIDIELNHSLGATGKYLFIYCLVFSLSLINPYI